jgi:hypothetical protein
MTVYHSVSGKEVQSLPAPEAMDGVNYERQPQTQLHDRRALVWHAGGFGRLGLRLPTDCDHYELISKIKTRPGSGTSLLVPQFKRLYVASQAIDEQDAAILVFEPVPRDRR